MLQSQSPPRTDWILSGGLWIVSLIGKAIPS